MNPPGGGADYAGPTLPTGKHIIHQSNLRYVTKRSLIVVGLKKRKKAKSSTLPTGKHIIHQSNLRNVTKRSLIVAGLKPAPVNARVVSSVVTQLEGGLYSKCHRIVVSVSNYTVQVSTQVYIFHCNCSILGRTEDNQIHLGAGAP